jgi:hypothetical protein
MVAGMIVTFMNVGYVQPTDEGLPSVVAATPHPTMSVSAEPTPTPTPTANVCDEPWEFDAAHTTISIPALGIVNHPITEYTRDNLVTEWVLGVEVKNAIVPEGNDTIVWYSSVDGSIISSCTPNTVYFFGHSNRFESAVFTNLPDLPVGSEIIIDTPTETLILELLPPEGLNYDGSTPENGAVMVYKTDLKNDPRYTDAVAGRFVFITCNAGGAFENGHSVANALSTFQLKNVVWKDSEEALER